MPSLKNRVKPHLSIFAVLAVASILGVSVLSIAIKQKQNRIQQSVLRIQAGIRSWLAQGRDPSAVLAVTNRIQPALERGDPDAAESLLKHALTMLTQHGETQDALKNDPSYLPVYAVKEKASDLYWKAEPVSIAGYEGSAMEPFISPDGHYLFFNNENDPKTNTNLYFAERTGRLAFRYRGELPGVNSPMLDAVPSIDIAGQFYFTTLRNYAATMNSIYTGHFDGKAVSNVHPVWGEISPTTPGAVNMDVSVSPDGRSLYISRALIVPGALAPRSSHLMLARWENGSFHIDPDGGRIFQNINTTALQYAPCVSANGLELYFSRASQPVAGAQVAGSVRIMLATRTALDQPFGEPRALRALTGFVEAPSLSLDGREMFFHKRLGERCSIFHAVRNSKASYEGARQNR